MRSDAGPDEDGGPSVEPRRTALLCRMLGHAGDWSQARTDGGQWTTRCSRCDERVIRSCSGGRWLAATAAISQELAGAARR